MQNGTIRVLIGSTPKDGGRGQMHSGGLLPFIMPIAHGVPRICSSVREELSDRAI